MPVHFVSHACTVVSLHPKFYLSPNFIDYKLSAAFHCFELLRWWRCLVGTIGHTEALLFAISYTAVFCLHSNFRCPSFLNICLRFELLYVYWLRHTPKIMARHHHKTHGYHPKYEILGAALLQVLQINWFEQLPMDHDTYECYRTGFPINSYQAVKKIR